GSSGHWLASGISPALSVGDSVTARQTANGVQSEPADAVVVVAAPPVLTAVEPRSGTQGQTNVAMTITGQDTHFTQGTTTVSLGGAGVGVTAVSVSSETTLSANVSIALNAAAASRTVTVTTGTEVAALPNGFTVLAATNQAPAITITPNWSVT